jgi:hypothetical protein
MDMQISNFAIIPIYIVSFIILVIQYFRINPDRRILNLRFLLMLGAVVLLFATVFFSPMHLSLAFFLLALFWLGLSLYLLRMMPPPKH